jgi:DMSO/TMAO reductase YedYZ molybdopterin-dependent catalytic subunit
MLRRLAGIGLIASFFVIIALAVAVVPGRLNLPIKLEGVEVREYNGSRLSSVNDFRENSIKGVQHVDIASYALQVDGLVENPENLTYAQVLSKQSYSKVVAIHCVEGWDATILWEGVLVKDLIDEAKARPEANTVIFHAYDGYTTSLPLDYVMNRSIILAYRMNGVTLPPERGFPFELIAEDKWGYKWIKWVTAIELSSDPSYRGFWESRGYSNGGDLDKPFTG